MRCPSLEQEILAYLLRHPQAHDKIEGIADWWLLEQRLRTVHTEVAQALALLRDCGFVIATVRAAGRTLFRFNASRLREAQYWLLRQNLPAPKPGTPRDPDAKAGASSDSLPTAAHKPAA